MYFAGIDVGSITTKTAIVDEKVNLLAFNVVPTGMNTSEIARNSLSGVCETAGIKVDDISRIISTGIGRANINFAHKQVTEISCHGRGASHLDPAIRTVIDIGGQDSKAIRIDGTGRVTAFAMNEKCAAGTGRFLEVMAQALHTRVEEMGAISKRAKNRAIVSNTCTVFAESEVVSLITQGSSQEDIIKGIHCSISERMMELLNRVGIEDAITMTGGVAKNSGVVSAMEGVIKKDIVVFEEPQIIGALGAAIFASELK